MQVALQVFIAGVVRPQGSLQLSRDPRTGREFARYSSTTVVWRQLLHGALSEQWGGREPIRSPVEVDLLASFARPKSHLGTGKNANRLKPSAPYWHATYPDADKAARGVGDALVQSGVLADDALISAWSIQKVWCDPSQRPGALVVVKELGSGDGR